MTGSRDHGDRADPLGEPVTSRLQAEGAVGTDLGLCGECWWARLVSSRSSSFLRCGRSDKDPSFGRYPPLPVLICAGHRALGSETEDTNAESV